MSLSLVTWAVQEHPKPKYTFETHGRFQRAAVTAFGRTRDEAVEKATGLRAALADLLPVDCTVWTPVYQGFDVEQRRHGAVIKVTLGRDKEDCREQLTNYLKAL